MAEDITVFVDADGNICGTCPAGKEAGWLESHRRHGNDHAVSQRRSTEAKWQAYARHRAGFHRTPDKERINEAEARAILFG